MLQFKQLLRASLCAIPTPRLNTEESMQLALSHRRGDRIRRLNDHARITFTGCLIVMTASVAELPDDTKARVLWRVRKFKEFDEDNDPHHEHDMAFFEHEGERFFFKFDYYGDPDYKTGANDPSDPAKTYRTLTIGKAEDY